MAEDQSNAEAHLIGSLINSLANTTELDVYGNRIRVPISHIFGGNGEQALPFGTAANAPVYWNYAAHPFAQQQLQQQPRTEFWTMPASSDMLVPPNSAPPCLTNQRQQIYFNNTPPQQFVAERQNNEHYVPRKAAGDFPAKVDEEKRTQLRHQNANPTAGAMGHRPELGHAPNYPPGFQEHEQHPQQWDSFYTPFGPVRTKRDDAAAAFRIADDLTNRNLGRPTQSVQVDDKKRSVSASSAGDESSTKLSNNLNQTTTDGIAASIRSRSYRDVVSSKSLSDRNSGSPLFSEKNARTVYAVSVRESSSESTSEFGENDSGNNNTSMLGSDQCTDGGGGGNKSKINAVEDLVGFIGKNNDDCHSGGRPAEKNVLKKNVTTTTTDFQKIIRRKNSQTKNADLGFIVQSSQPPVMAAAVAGRGRKNDKQKVSKPPEVKPTRTVLQPQDAAPLSTDSGRFGVLSKNSPATSPVKSDSTADATERNGERQQQTKLNNQQTMPMLNVKSPASKAAYINNDLSWPTIEPVNDGRTPELPAWTEVDHLQMSDELNVDDAELEEVACQLKPRTGGKSERKSRDEEINAKTAAGPATLTGGLQRGNVKKSKVRRVDLDVSATKKRKQQPHIIVQWLNLLLSIIACYCRDAAIWLFTLLADIGHQLCEITVYFCVQCWTSITLWAEWSWITSGQHLRRLLLRARQKEWSIWLWWRSWRKGVRDSGNHNDLLGLGENIELPNTGEDALKRLLSYRGQDAYSILGLRSDCTDEDIKCYYRRQAILVHPDKNGCYGAEEAFKILAAAFEMIGTPEKRQLYDLENLHRTKAMKELEKMLSKLKDKVEELKSTMQCDCGRKHKRFATDRSLWNARYCRRCSGRHHAREGDIWAESHYVGFLWYYYACMEGVIYDITEWAGCQKNNLKHMKPDTHLIQYRLITGRHTRQQQQQQQQQRPANSASSFASLSGMGSTSGSNNRQTSNRSQHNKPSSENADISLEEAMRSGLFDQFDSQNGFPTEGASTASDNDFTSTAQSKFCPSTGSMSSDSRPRKAGRRRKSRF